MLVTRVADAFPLLFSVRVCVCVCVCVCIFLPVLQRAFTAKSLDYDDARASSVVAHADPIYVIIIAATRTYLYNNICINYTQRA